MNHKQRVRDLMDAWAPLHAKELMAQGWRLSDGDGLVWVRDDKPSLFLPDENARRICRGRRAMESACRSAGDYRDSARCDQLDEQLDALPSYERAAEQRCD